MDVKKMSDRMLCAYIEDTFEGVFGDLFDEPHGPKVEIVMTCDITGARDLCISLKYNNKIKLEVRSNYFKISESKINEMLDQLQSNYYGLMAWMNKNGRVRV